MNAGTNDCESKSTTYHIDWPNHWWQLRGAMLASCKGPVCVLKSKLAASAAHVLAILALDLAPTCVGFGPCPVPVGATLFTAICVDVRARCESEVRPMIHKHKLQPQHNRLGPIIALQNGVHIQRRVPDPISIPL